MTLRNRHRVTAISSRTEAAGPRAGRSINLAWAIAVKAEMQSSPRPGYLRPWRYMRLGAAAAASETAARFCRINAFSL